MRGKNPTQAQEAQAACRQKRTVVMKSSFKWWSWTQRCEAYVTQAWRSRSSLGLWLFCLLSLLGHFCLTCGNLVLSLSSRALCAVMRPNVCGCYQPWSIRGIQENIMQSRFNWLSFFCNIDPVAVCTFWWGRWGRMFRSTTEPSLMIVNGVFFFHRCWPAGTAIFTAAFFLSPLLPVAALLPFHIFRATVAA